eukprot:1734166-Amphidinium_carterae.2
MGLARTSRLTPGKVGHWSCKCWLFRLTSHPSQVFVSSVDRGSWAAKNGLRVLSRSCWVRYLAQVSSEIVCMTLSCLQVFSLVTVITYCHATVLPEHCMSHV